jgi:hypothetical protein
MTREWHAIAFVSSLHFTRGPNLALYAGAILDSLTATLFAVNLYFVIIASPQPLDVSPAAEPLVPTAADAAAHHH